jgi:glycosyltransferase involved in cell wall biosynthesis
MSLHKVIKVCFFTKYPPIEGGVSASAYWSSRALARKGIEVHIVTNSLEVEDEFREKIDLKKKMEKGEYQPKNVFVHNLNSPPDSHIPYSRAYLERLIGLGLKVIKENKCDIIDSYYFQPYGLAAIFTKLLTKKPCIIRHAGSDISRLFLNDDLNAIYKKSFQVADIIVTSPYFKNFFERCGVSEGNLYFKPFVPTDLKYFNPKVKAANLIDFGVPGPLLKKPVFSYIGKYSDHKGLFDLVKAVGKIKEDFLLLFVTGGFGLENFRSYIKSMPSLRNKYYFLDFQAPWKIPSIIKATNCLFQLENNFPIKGHTPFQPIEAMALSVPVLISNEILEKYKKLLQLENNHNVLAVNPKNHQEIRMAFLKIIKNSKEAKRVGKRGSQKVFSLRKSLFERSITNQVALYKKLIKMN